MEYRKLGDADIEVTTLALGTWAFGGDKWWGKQSDLASEKTLHRAIELGVNLIDTAPVYGNGHSEGVIGQFLKREKLRDKVVLATKVGLRWENENSEISFPCLSKASILKELNESLSRLKTDVIDLYQVHYPDEATPIAETAQTLNKIYQQGKVRSIGVSNFSVEQIQEFMKSCPLHSVQPKYNMFRREIEEDILPFCRKNNIAVIVHSPLNSGILTGKFFFGKSVPQDKVRDVNYDVREENFDLNKQTLENLAEIAKKYDKTTTHLALNWIMAQVGVTSAIAGARDLKQIEDNVGACGWNMKEEDLRRIEQILIKREKEVKTSFEYN